MGIKTSPVLLLLYGEGAYAFCLPDDKVRFVQLHKALYALGTYMVLPVYVLYGPLVIPVPWDDEH